MTCPSAVGSPVKPRARQYVPVPQDVTKEPADTLHWAALWLFSRAKEPGLPGADGTAASWCLPRAVPRHGHRAPRTHPPPHPLLRAAPGRPRSPGPQAPAPPAAWGTFPPQRREEKHFPPVFLPRLGSGSASPSRLGPGERGSRDAAAARGAGAAGAAYAPPAPGPRPPGCSSPGASRKEEGGENGFHFRLLAGTTSPQNILGQ